MQEFSKFLGEYQGGILDDTLGKELAKLTEAVSKQGKKGTMSLNIILKPAGNGKMDLSITYAAKPPIDNTVSGLMFVDDDNNLVPTDPNQLALPGLSVVKKLDTPEQKRQVI